ncbi:hypothetical protein OHA25_08650 [Nonomuraea sp. NBC_00507]|uniref:hypothetical protein n=1 Tax=Nonomuraea sp. NBC_00507 TaxID=2976002 RepID=UPI002E1799B7
MCTDCRRQRAADQRPPGFAHELADAIAPGRAVEPGAVDHALILSEDLQRVMSHVGRVALLIEDATLLLRVARRAGRIDPGLLLRVSEAIAEAHAATSHRLTGTNAIPEDQIGSDHGDTSTPLAYRSGLGAGGTRDPDPP